MIRLCFLKVSISISYHKPPTEHRRTEWVPCPAFRILHWLFFFGKCILPKVVKSKRNSLNTCLKTCLNGEDQIKEVKGPVVWACPFPTYAYSLFAQGYRYQFFCVVFPVKQRKEFGKRWSNSKPSWLPFFTTASCLKGKLVSGLVCFLMTLYYINWLWTCMLGQSKINCTVE